MMKYLLMTTCLVALFFGSLSGPAMAQGSIDWEELWRNVPPPPNQTTHPNAWMITARSFTGLAYDKWRDVLYVVNPHTTQQNQFFWQTPRIHIWNAETGQPAMNIGRSAHATVAGQGGEIPVPLDTITNWSTLFRGFSQNTYSLYKIDLDDEGRIFACNLVSPIWGICILLASGLCDPVFLGQGPFRVWRWDTPTSTPLLAYATLNPAGSAIGGLGNSEMTYTRWGDAFDVIGKRSMYYPPNQDPPYLVDSIRIYTSGGSWPTQPNWNREVNVILADPRPENQRPNRDAGGGKLDYRLAVRLVNSNSGLASHGVAGTANTLVHDVWMSSNPRLLTAAMHVQTASGNWPQVYNQLATGNRSLSTNLTGMAGPIKYFELPQYGRKFLVLGGGQPTGGLDPSIPNQNTIARMLDVTQPGQDKALWGPTPMLGNKTLNNNSGEENYIADVDVQVKYYSPDDDPDYPGLHAILYVLMSNNGIAAFRSRRAFPVELSTLTATVNGEMVDLSWSITMETNNHGFEIQRSFDHGTNWENIGFVPGRGTTTQPWDYTYQDPVTPTHRNIGNVKYRLRQVDIDGTHTFSPTVDAYFDAVPSMVTLYQNYPNPFNPTTTIGYQLTENSHVTLKVYNTLGEHVGTLVDDYKQAGAHQITMTAEQLPSGTYVYQINANGHVAQKKMTVMK